MYLYSPSKLHVLPQNSTDVIFLSSVKFSSTSISRTLRDLIPMVKKRSSTKLLIVLFIKCLLITKKKKKEEEEIFH